MHVGVNSCVVSEAGRTECLYNARKAELVQNMLQLHFLINISS